ncbi:hydroxymethylbilane synthase [Robertkochia solimangrovi]|uniref:hydroxymethylbilane synthase n=1 Tax=Robertkochia solimangrovi TaxID=2213046 RepID=UPI00117EF9A6|nr:hydroxymethylbilane synthase [Robertkochia solimangrovi]TRZ45952.1 hydroxymethylbilane synthase [Robertkochia solimangrovi]
MNRMIRIGTRDSELALWQAKYVQQQLESFGCRTELVPVKSTGDLILDKPLYELGITGVFTKTLDVAMLKGEIDIAVHSMKDVPTQLPKGIVKAAVPERANVHDLLVYKNNNEFLNNKKALIATGSLRRKAQWLNQFPKHQITDLRGNVNTRLQKLEDNDWNGAIFAAAGLERIGIKPEKSMVLDWMVPAPAQGAMMVVAKEEDTDIINALKPLNSYETDICTTIEREFLRTLEGGCTAPIGALATIDVDYLCFTGVLLSLDGKQKISIEKKILIEHFEGLGVICAQELLADGGQQLMKKVRKELEKK